MANDPPAFFAYSAATAHEVPRRQIEAMQFAALEERFGLTVNDDEISADAFETVGSLHSFVVEKLSA